ncbi:hypothetical protein PRIC2_007200 [Phytophthora ramorum]
MEEGATLGVVVVYQRQEYYVATQASADRKSLVVDLLQCQLLSLVGVMPDEQILLSSTGEVLYAPSKGDVAAIAVSTGSRPRFFLFSSAEATAGVPEMASDWRQICTKSTFGNIEVVQPAFRKVTPGGEDPLATLICEPCAKTCTTAFQPVNPMKWNTASRFISEVAVVAGDVDVGAPSGFTKLPVELNFSASGDYVYLCVKRGGPRALTQVHVLLDRRDDGIGKEGSQTPEEVISGGIAGDGNEMNIRIGYDLVQLKGSMELLETLAITDIAVVVELGGNALKATRKLKFGRYAHIAVVRGTHSVTMYINGTETGQVDVVTETMRSVDGETAFIEGPTQSISSGAAVISHVALIPAKSPAEVRDFCALMKNNFVSAPPLRAFGPDGELSGRRCFDTAAEAQSGYRVSRVKMWGGQFFDGLQFVYEKPQKLGDENTTVFGALLGNADAKRQASQPTVTLKLLPDEIITRVSGHKGAWTDCITLHTNFGRSVTCGGNGGGHFSVPAPSKSEIRSVTFKLGDHLTDISVFVLETSSAESLEDEATKILLGKLSAAEPASRQSAISAALRYLDNIARQPEEPKFQRIRASNKYFAASVGVLGDEAAKSFMSWCGFEESSEQGEQFFVFQPCLHEEEPSPQRLAAEAHKRIHFLKNVGASGKSFVRDQFISQFALKGALDSTQRLAPRFVTAHELMSISAPTISATDVSGLLARGSSPQRNNAVQIGKCPPPRTRRPRTPIALTEEDMRTLSPDEIRKKKNRVSAQRDRDRKKQHVQDLEDMVCELWKRVQYLEGVITSMHPNQDLSGLYHSYEPYDVSRSLQPLTGPTPGGLNEVDMTELAWLLDSMPMDPCSED